MDNTNIYDYEMEIDTKAIVAEANKPAEKSGDLPKTVWHNLPNDDSSSEWRFLPYFKKKTFYFKIEKHWDIPGLPSRTVTCPRSFVDSSTGQPFACAICEKRIAIYKSKSKDDGDEVIKQALKTQTNYLTNAIDVKNTEKGIGVLALSYAIWQSLMAFLESPYSSSFFQVKTGKNVWIKATYKAGTVVPGASGKQKRDFTVQASPTPNPIQDVSILEGLYDLETVLGVPTYETTKGWLAKLLSGDPNAGTEFLTGAAYHNRLGTGVPAAEAEDTPFPTRTFPTQETFVETTTSPFDISQQNVSNKVDHPVASSNVPTTAKGDDGFPICYSEAFDENNKTCLRCEFSDSCETSILKRKRDARKLSTPDQVVETKPSEDIKKSGHDDVAAEMMRILNMGL